MAVKTTKIQCNQDVDLRGKVDVKGKVTCGIDVDVDGALTINSAKDLKTKDGSTFGGSSVVYEQTKKVGEDLYLPDGFTDRYLKGETLGVFYESIPLQYTYTGQLIAPLSTDGSSLGFCFLPTSDGKIDVANIKNIILATWTQYSDNVKFFGITEMDGSISGILQTGDTATYGKIKINNNKVEYLSQYWNYFDVNNFNLLTVMSGEITSGITVPRDFATKSQEINLGDINTNKSEIAKKQSTLYRHTVTFTQGIEPDFKGRFTFTDKSEKNTPIDSIQDLIAVFGNTDIQLSGCANFDQAYIMEKIHVGSSVDDTKFFYTNIDDYYMPQDNSYSAFDTGDTITITDNVTAM